MLTRREGKYTSASPRCTCLPPRQHCAGVALGSPPPTPQHCWFGRRTSTTRLRLIVLASSSSTMLWSCTRWTSDSNAMLILRKDKYTSAMPRCTWTWTLGTWAESAKYTSPRCGTYTITQNKNTKERLKSYSKVVFGKALLIFSVFPEVNLLQLCHDLKTNSQ